MPLPKEIIQFQLYGEATAPNVPDMVHVELIADRAVQHNWEISPHRHPNIVQMLFFDGGHGELTSVGAPQILNPPTAVLLPTDCPHAFHFQPNAKGWVLSVAEALLLDPRLTITRKKEFLQRNSTLQISLAERPGQAELLRQLIGDIERRRDNANIAVTDSICALLTLLFSTLEEIAGDQERTSNTAISPRRQLYQRFLQLVEKQFRGDWKIEEYSEALGTSQATLTRACRDASEKSPSQIVTERRILEAKRSLSLTGASVSRIASELGYADPSYFARNFLRHTGMTASDFRRSNTQPVTKSRRKSSQNKQAAQSPA